MHVPPFSTVADGRATETGASGEPRESLVFFGSDGEARHDAPPGRGGAETMPEILVVTAPESAVEGRPEAVAVPDDTVDLGDGEPYTAKQDSPEPPFTVTLLGDNDLAERSVRSWQQGQYRAMAFDFFLGATATAAIGAVVLELGQLLAARRAGAEELAVAVTLNQFLLLATLLPLFVIAPAVVLAIWVAQDTRRRRMPTAPAAGLTLALGPLGAAIHLARRRLLPGELREGGFGWNVCRHLAVLWLACLAFWLAVLLALALWGIVRGYPVVTLVVGGGAAAMIWASMGLVVLPIFTLACLGYLLKVERVVEEG